MKRVFLSGDKGFIARNLKEINNDRVYFINNDIIQNDVCNQNLIYLTSKNEIDIVETDTEFLKQLLKTNKCDLIVHNAAIVGTDVCALYPKHAIINNVYGTYNMAIIARELNIPILYLGTTVIYDTQDPKIQNDRIYEDSPINPRTLYASTKYEGELIIKSHCEKSRYSILRPLFCYGGEGDMNSLIAKTIYNDISGRKRDFKIFLDPTKIKDYMHVNDFCEAIMTSILDETILTSNDDFNISADIPIKTSEIAEMIRDVAEVDISYIKWVPETDYLGNHIVENSKFKLRSKWNSKISLKTGIEITKQDCVQKLVSSTYNPFIHLDKIEKEKINIESHYNFGK